MKPQDTTAMDIRQIREEMEKILDENGIFPTDEYLSFKTPESETRYYELRTELRKLVNTKR